MDKLGIFPENQICMRLVCLFVLLIYVPSQQLWSWQDEEFT